MSEHVEPATPRTLDWRPYHDPRSRNYPVRELIPANAHRHDRMWGLPSQVLDQGREGQCVGFAFAHEALATPVRVDLAKLKADAPADPTRFASHIYKSAQRLDEWPGEAYSGTSVLAGAKAMQGVGLIREYRWAFGIDDVVDAVIWKGPVVLGIPWYSGMYRPVNGVVQRTGAVVGGHAILAIGYRKSSPALGGEPAVVLLNSWGPNWGNNGVADIAVPDLAALLKEDGEACIPTRRSYGR